MPELPEVETTLQGIKPHLKGQKIKAVIVRHHQLRWPIPEDLPLLLKDKSFISIKRRAKYLLFCFEHGTLILHLGMSGKLRILSKALPPEKHDHFDIVFCNQTCLRLTDPRRFGAVLWTTQPPEHHPLLRHLGIEPLDPNFQGGYLWQKAQGRSMSIKNFLMNAKIVTGIGNIYAAEALFAAKIHPETAACKVSIDKMHDLAKQIKIILKEAIEQGGTTLKDFTQPSGKSGYFVTQLKVYGRENQPCVVCRQPLTGLKQGQRSTVYCQNCQI